jgi:hypothetical protein
VKKKAIKVIKIKRENHKIFHRKSAGKGSQTRLIKKSLIIVVF